MLSGAFRGRGDFYRDQSLKNRRGKRTWNESGRRKAKNEDSLLSSSEDYAIRAPFDSLYREELLQHRDNHEVSCTSVFSEIVVIKKNAIFAIFNVIFNDLGHIKKTNKSTSNFVSQLCDFFD